MQTVREAVQDFCHQKKSYLSFMRGGHPGPSLSPRSCALFISLETHESPLFGLKAAETEARMRWLREYQIEL